MPTKTLARIRPTRGLSYDVPPWEVGNDFYTRLRNMLIRNGFAQRIGGRRSAYATLSAAPHHIQNIRDLGNNFWIYYGVSSIYGVNGATHTDLTPGGGLSSISKSYQWNSTLLNAIPCANNGLDAPMYWTGDTLDNFAALPDWPASTLAKMLVAFRYHLFALDITVSGANNPNLFLWSDAADPGDIPQSWTPAASNEAGFAQLSDRAGSIVAARRLRDSLIVYKENSSYAIRYVGGNEKFGVSGLWSNAGAVNTRAVDDIDGKHVVVTNGDIVINDGYSEPISIANALVRNFLFAQLDETNFGNLQVIYDAAKQDVWIAFPESGSEYCTLALVYNKPSNAWGVVELPDVAHIAVGVVDDETISDVWEDDEDPWDGDSSIWNQDSLAGVTESVVFASASTTELIQTNTVDALVTDAMVAKYSMHFDEPERLKLVRRVNIRGADFASLFVRVGSQMFPEGPVTWSEEREITAPGQPVDLFAQGRYISIEVRSVDDSVWTLTGFDFEIDFKGFY